MKQAFYDWWGLNVVLFSQINGLHWAVLDNLMLIVTTLGHPNLYPFYLAGAMWHAWRRPGRAALGNVATFAIAYPLVSVIAVPALKRWMDFPRPLSVLGADAVVVIGAADPAHSFPSGHAAFAVLMAASLIPGAPTGARMALVVFATLVCVSRIWVGAHFPADVVGGALLAVLAVAIVRRILPHENRA